MTSPSGLTRPLYYIFATRIRVLAALILCVIAFETTSGYLRDSIRDDFTTFSLAASRVMVEGGDPYDKEQVGKHFKYLPFNALVLTPLAILPIPWAQAFWSALNVALLFGCVVMHLDAAKGSLPSRPKPHWKSILVWAKHNWTWLFVLIYAIRFFHGNLQHGQWNMSAYALAAMGLLAAKKRPWVGGSLVGLAAVIKYMPGFFLIFFVAQRRWKAAGGVLFGVVLFAAIVPTAFLGPKRHMDLFQGYINKATEKYSEMRADESLVGVSMRTTVYCFLRPAIRRDYSKSRTVNLATLTPSAAKGIADGVCWAILLSTLAFTVWKGRERDAVRYMNLMGLWFAALLLISPETRADHMLTLFTSSFALAAWLEKAERTDRGRPWIRSIFIAFIAIALLCSGALPNDFGDLLIMYGMYTLMILMLGAGNAICVLDEAESPRNSGSNY